MDEAMKKQGDDFMGTGPSKNWKTVEMSSSCRYQDPNRLCVHGQGLLLSCFEFLPRLGVAISFLFWR